MAPGLPGSPRASAVLALMLATALGAQALAEPRRPVTSGFGAGERAEVSASLDYRLDATTSAIRRERSGLEGADPSGPIPIAKDLRHRGVRHLLVPRLDFGLVRDLSVSVALPVTLHDTRELSFDQRSSPCVFPGGEQRPTCVNADNSTTVRDGLLPATGYDARSPTGAGFTTPGDATIFRGPLRQGIDQLHLGLTWAAMNHARDRFKPTWKLGGEARLAVGKPMRLDRNDPRAESGVGRGVHELRLWSSMEKPTSWALPYVEFWWQAPIGTRSDSLFIEPGFGQTRASPQQRAGTRFGFETSLWERPERGQRVDLRMHAVMEAFFEGRTHSEMWEIFQYAGDARYDGPLILDADPTREGRQALSHPGVSNVQNHLELGGGLGLGTTLGGDFKLDAGFDLMHRQAHAISFTAAGVDRDGSGIIEAGSDEVNPLYAPTIDQTGHRYRSHGGLAYAAMIRLAATF
jgi:hypothetical protein